MSCYCIATLLRLTKTLVCGHRRGRNYSGKPSSRRSRTTLSKFRCSLLFAKIVKERWTYRSIQIHTESVIKLKVVVYYGGIVKWSEVSWHRVHLDLVEVNTRVEISCQCLHLYEDLVRQGVWNGDLEHKEHYLLLSNGELKLKWDWVR